MASSLSQDVYIAGIHETPMIKGDKSPLELMAGAVRSAVADAGLREQDIGAIICGPTMQHDVMVAHYVARMANLRQDIFCKTLDCGGASACVAVIEAVNLIRSGAADIVAVASGDAVLSMKNEEFVRLLSIAGSKKPVAAVYDVFAQWHMQHYGTTREQLASVAVLDSLQAARHPHAMVREPFTVQRVLDSRPVALVTNSLECARRADGAAALVLVSDRVYRSHPFPHALVRVAGCGQAAAPLLSMDSVTADNAGSHPFPLRRAAREALSASGLSISDIHHFSLYDCFPVALLTAVEDIGLVARGHAGRWIQEQCIKATRGEVVPINTHGGLLCHGAPFSAASVFLLVESVLQLRGQAQARQVPEATNALVYGNGGTFSHAAVVILQRASEGGPLPPQPQQQQSVCLPPTRLTRLLGMRYPIMSAGMGGVAGADLAAAVSNAGGFGCMGCSTWSVAPAREELARCAAMVGGNPWGCNLIISALHFNAILDLILKARPTAFITGLGVNPDVVTRCHAAGILVGCVVGSVKHALYAVEMGADFVIAQGTEGGGHTGSIALMALLPQVIDAVGHRVPVAAAGGMCDGRTVAAALYALGADAVWIGSRFLASVEATTVRGYKEAVVASAWRPDDPTTLTTEYTGKQCRVLRNEYTETHKRQPRPKVGFLDALRRSIADNAYHLGSLDASVAVDLQREFMPIGQCARALYAVLPAGEIVRRLVSELRLWLQSTRARL